MILFKLKNKSNFYLPSYLETFIHVKHESYYNTACCYLLLYLNKMKKQIIPN